MSEVESGRKGWVTLVKGPMFAGKTEEGFRRLRRVVGKGGVAAVYRPRIDTRDGEGVLRSHDGAETECVQIADASEVSPFVHRCDESGCHLRKANLVWIDEVQFFEGEALRAKVTALRDAGIDVLLTGLDFDFMRHAFATTEEMEGVATEVIRLTAKCVRCGKAAEFSHRTVPCADRILIGAEESYEPICEDCWGSV